MQARLHSLQKAAWEKDLAVIVLFESWDAAGKGACIRALTSGLDPRGFKLYAIREARAFETRKPWMWRFWRRIPAWGELVIFDRSWYGRVLGEYVDGLISEEERRRALQDILDFERTLADEGVLICKFFLHISPEEQKKRFKQRLKNPNASWRVEPDDWEQHAKYPAYYKILEETFEQTTMDWAPWTVVAASNQRYAQLTIQETLIAALENHPDIVTELPAQAAAPPHSSEPDPVSGDPASQPETPAQAPTTASTAEQKEQAGGNSNHRRGRKPAEIEAQPENQANLQDSSNG